MSYYYEAIASLQRQVSERIAEDATTPCTLTFERANALLIECDKLHELAWKLIDAIEEVRGARTRGEEDWKALNKADADLRRELQQATGEKT